jgi:hypothetical protein
MSLFDDRERAFELKYVHDLEAAFRMRVIAMRDMARWAADRLGLIGSDADSYVSTHAHSVLTRDGSGLLLKRLAADLKDRDLGVSEQELTRVYDGFCASALMRMQTLPDAGEAGMVARKH